MKKMRKVVVAANIIIIIAVASSLLLIMHLCKLLDVIFHKLDASLDSRR
jgi:hypothetical protein